MPLSPKQLGGALLLGWCAWNLQAPPAGPVSPEPKPPAPRPSPPPAPPAPPKPRPGPWGGDSKASVEAKVGGFTSPDGGEAQCPLPGEFHIKNRGGSDGAGLCVFASIQHSAKWQSVPQLEDLFSWMFKHPGGGYPEKVDRMINQKCKEQNLPVPDYLQVQGSDLEVLRRACESGRMPGVTYSFSPSGRYNGQRISHMVSLPAVVGDWYGVLDNNYPGVDQIEWLTEAEFKRAYTGGSSGWSVILLEAPPPPVPRN